jgi:predicted nucleic acid-binding protein
MTGFLLDTNVPSELTRPQSDPQVEKWLDDADDEQLFLSVIPLGEIFKGLTILPESKRRQQLQQWMDETLRPWFNGRILPITERIAERWGILASSRRKPEKGRGAHDGRWLDSRDRPGARPDGRHAQCEGLCRPGRRRIESLVRYIKALNSASCRGPSFVAAKTPPAVFSAM